MRRGVAICLCCAVWLLGAAWAHGQYYAYGMDRTSRLYRVNTGTGTVEVIGALGIGPVTGSAIDPNSGILYTNPGGGGCCPTAVSGCLYSVSTLTGTATQIGCDPNQGGNDPIPGMAFSPAGVFYGVRLASNAEPQDNNMYLCTINTSNGVLTDIGSISSWCEGYGMAFGSDGLLYSWNSCDGLSTVNTSNASTTVIGGSLIGFPTNDDLKVPDMALDPSGQLWAVVVDVDASPKRYYLGRVNTTTGNIMFACQMRANIQTLAFTDQLAPAGIPTLSEWGAILLAGLMALIAAGLLARRRTRAA